MNKRKIALLAMSACMIAILAIGGTLAYFTDTDTETNVFTLGNVEIDLVEEYEQNATVLPDEENKTTKEVDVTNTGVTPAYVRVHIALPSALVDKDLMSYNDMLHINFTKASAGTGLWSWLPTYTAEGLGWTGNGAANFNHYFTDIDGVNHLVYVVTYRSALAAGATTADHAMYAFYLDQYIDAEQEGDVITYSKKDFADGTRTTAKKDANGEDLYMTYEVTKNADGKFTDSIKVFAEGTQATENFTDAYDALNTAFGQPTAEKNPWNNYGIQ